MNTSPVQNIAPFIDKEFTVVSEWWKERINPVTGLTEIHKGLDISTYDNDPIYSMLKGHIHSKGYTSTAGNWVIISDDIVGSRTYGYATRYLHLRDSVLLNVGDPIEKGEQVGIEGMTGQATGVHLHLEMQNISLFNWEWHVSNNQSDYINPCEFMGIDNVQGTKWIYESTPVQEDVVINKFSWVLYAEMLRDDEEYNN